ncbi:TniQ family protein [Paenibacillus humicus]|uniref:TniQ family protein n=1 Tax=Paenibacillus humicus TaxID=412861 RepID=UPI003F1890FD
MSLRHLPIVYPDESFMSLALRMAKANGHQTLQTLVRRGTHYFDYRANFNYFKEGTLWNESLVQLLEQNGYKQLERHMLNQFDAVLFGDKAPSPLQLRRHYYQTKVKYCPRCLEEKGYHRLDWDISLVGMCLKHDTQLLDQCPRCQRVIRLDNIIGGGCYCGFGYVNLMKTTSPHPRIKKAQEVIQAVLSGKLQVVALEDGTRLTGAQYMERLQVLMQLLDNMPSDPEFGDYRFSYKLVKGERKDNTIFLSLSAMAHELLTTPSRGFRDMVRIVELEKKSHRSHSSTRSKRSLFNQIIRDPLLALHRTLYFEEHNSHHEEYVRMMYMCDVSERQYCSLLYARQRILHCDNKRLLQFQRLGWLTCIERQYGGKKITLVERVQVEQLAARRSFFLTTGEVGKLLEIPQKMVVKLAKANLLIMERGPEKDGFGHRVFMPKALDNLLHELNRSSFYLSGSILLDWMPLSQQEIHSRRHHASFSDVVQAVLNGRIQCGKTKRSITSFSDLVISVSDFTRFYDREE